MQVCKYASTKHLLILTKHLFTLTKHLLIPSKHLHALTKHLFTLTKHLLKLTYNYEALPYLELEPYHSALVNVVELQFMHDTNSEASVCPQLRHFFFIDLKF